jgi:hypothetical protein
MAHGTKKLKFGAAFLAFAMFLSSTAYASPSRFNGVDPLIALSAFGTSSSRAAVCAAGTRAATAAGTAAQSGSSCLPFLAAAAAASSQQETGMPHAQATEPRPMIEALALPLGVFAAGVLAILLLDDKDEDDFLDDDDNDCGVCAC